MSLFISYSFPPKQTKMRKQWKTPPYWERSFGCGRFKRLPQKWFLRKIIGKLKLETGCGSFKRLPQKCFLRKIIRKLKLEMLSRNSLPQKTLFRKIIWMWKLETLSTLKFSPSRNGTFPPIREWLLGELVCRFINWFLSLLTSFFTVLNFVKLLLIDMFHSSPHWLKISNSLENDWWHAFFSEFLNCYISGRFLIRLGTRQT